MGPIAVTIAIDPNGLRRTSDQWLAMAWTVAQFNPAADGDPDATRLARAVGDEIIRRWLRNVDPQMHRHRDGDAHSWLTAFAKYEPPPRRRVNGSGEPDFDYGKWVPLDPDEAATRLQRKHTDADKRLAARLAARGEATPPGPDPGE